ncbi:MAG: DUF1289 domain-containing protein [Gammaproteobacteria bacterium]|nr:DUF1289 domain-containing protein [Gammaproteobacteria bacterium]MDP2139257.1 DUF1289 domain-containing protein [Gammaproteobacteria bacterium]MDP2348974.1 DUF1289 domain-containing protein [Gammaproteobacteria bacterium]
MNTNSTRTPCIGICSTTSVGDAICRGCKRYAFEVIRWNGYSESEKEAVLRRIETLTVQILQDKFVIMSEDQLRSGLERCKLPVNPSVSPYCWLHNLLKKGPIATLIPGDYGVMLAQDCQQIPLEELAEQIDEELLVLCAAHFSRYFQRVDSLA